MRNSILTVISVRIQDSLTKDYLSDDDYNNN
jgi:hypothetical protein